VTRSGDAAARKRVPVPFDQYVPWDGVVDPGRPLTSFQAAFVAACFPSEHLVDARPSARYFGPGHPIWLRLLGPAGERTVLLRMDSFRGGVETEAALLPVLARAGLPVPELLAGPATDPERPNAGPMTVISPLPGRDLQASARGASPDELAILCVLVLDAVERLHGATEHVAADPVAARLPHRTLASELEEIERRGGPWLNEPFVRDALAHLAPLAAVEMTPLVFSNGDYNPGNFLADSSCVTGFLDFAQACFEDPHAGFARFWLYDWQPYARAGLVERHLERHGVSERAFALRLGIRCLWTLQRGIPVAGHDEEFGSYRARVLGIAERALQVSG
jgi:aminoglycoside phosphotransferase